MEHRDVAHNLAINFERVECKFRLLLESNAFRQGSDKIAAKTPDSNIHLFELIGGSRAGKNNFVELFKKHTHGECKGIDISPGIHSLFHPWQHHFGNNPLADFTEKHGSR